MRLTNAPTNALRRTTNALADAHANAPTNDANALRTRPPIPPYPFVPSRAASGTARAARIRTRLRLRCARVQTLTPTSGSQAGKGWNSPPHARLRVESGNRRIATSARSPWLSRRHLHSMSTADQRPSLGWRACRPSSNARAAVDLAHTVPTHLPVMCKYARNCSVSGVWPHDRISWEGVFGGTSARANLTFNLGRIEQYRPGARARPPAQPKRWRMEMPEC
jgi:hypothetical protein